MSISKALSDLSKLEPLDDEPDVHTETSSIALTPVTYEGAGNVKMKYDRDNKTANVLLEKFLPSWSEYHNHLKHKKKDLNLQELISHMRTEEANRLKDKEISNSSISFKANLVESSPSRKDRLQPKGKKFQKGGQQKTFKGNDGKIQKTKNSAAYRFMCLKDSSICESSDAEFFEQEFPLIDSHNSHKVSNPSSTPMIPSTTELRRTIYALIIHQMDVKTTFLNGDLNEEIYMEQPKGFAFSGQEDKVLINDTKRFLSSQFEMKDLGEADVILEGFCDANWVTDNDEVSSTSGYVFTLGGGAISWKSVKQTCIARSTMESEFIALELTGQEAEWLRNSVGDMPMWGSSVPVSIHCDSQAAIE
ncbi:UNVERIFIED_CONTAM: Retrovirus-related Pol polyprotein from transposon TNT 1-94 [Sesamum calycinum]|uniref:Retrovirus-related Pol polyprotein from transposon TNT 1-94 n=1 Tax=Sesamum calycinum TaxID=2727403 RepID=A0AAW2SFG9_9LAMI